MVERRARGCRNKSTENVEAQRGNDAQFVAGTGRRGRGRVAGGCGVRRHRGALNGAGNVIERDEAREGEGSR